MRGLLERAAHRIQASAPRKTSTNEVASAAWGSRYPHHDASPGEAIANLRRWSPSEEVVAAYMGGTVARHFGL